MSRLYDRRAVLTVETKGTPAFGESPAREFRCGNDGFDLAFDIHKDLTGKPNRAKISIFNMTQEHRDDISERVAKGPARVRLDAGYGTEIHRIYEGDIRILDHRRGTGTDWATHFESADGEYKISTARISKSWAAGTPVSTVIRDLAGALGIGEGNVRTSTAGALLEGLGPTFPGGTAVSGRAFKELTRICRSAGLEWSIQDGTLQFLVGDKALSATAVKLTDNTGLEGDTELHRTKKQTLLKARMRLIPNVWPGRKIALADGSVYRVSKAHYVGQTKGNAWGITVECTPL